ncbi:hypothetical protein [Neptunicella sp. SCSIO 80796]|uniref:hypothetical protein n=1 Tax=Neptunicella plasticusilytica TaxID=3117012 RepID=UPI003A4E12D1
MLKNILVQILWVVVLAGFISGQAQAIEKLNGADIQAVCNAFEIEQDSPTVNNDRALCAMYLKGFLAGEELYRADQLPAATFRQKALHSRAGGLLEKYQISGDISYCIPKDITIEDIALLISQHKPATDKLAENLLKDVLQQHFQCIK